MGGPGTSTSYSSSDAYGGRIITIIQSVMGGPGTSTSYSSSDA